MDSRRIQNKPQIRPLRWTVLGYFYAKSVGMIVGKRSGGKSLFIAWFASMVSRGRYIDADGCERKTRPLNVQINVVSEDPLEEMWHPRLKVAGADMNHVRVTEETYLFPASLGKLRDDLLASRRAGFKVDLLIFDSMGTHLKNPYFGFRDNRTAMNGMVALAEQMDMTIIWVHHLRKGRASTVESAIGGQGILQAASKAIYIVSPFPNSTSPTRVLACERINGPMPSALQFDLQFKRIPETTDPHPCLNYIGPIDVSAREVYDASRKERAGSGKTGVNTGAEFIREFFARSKQPVVKLANLDDAMREGGAWFSKGTAERARAQAGLRTITDNKAREMLGYEYAFAAGDADGRTRWCFLPMRNEENSSPSDDGGEHPNLRIVKKKR